MRARTGNGTGGAVRRAVWSWAPRSDREAADATTRNLLLHWFPSKVAPPSFAGGYSLYLGAIAAALFLILIATGIGLMFLYVPSVERAYGSVKDIGQATTFGAILRGQHRMAAHLMVAVAFLHMMRVFFTGAYRSAFAAGGARPVNWVVGVAMLLATLFLSFTGYLLPWDQLAYWAITVGTNIARAAPVAGEPMRYLLLGGNSIDQPTLTRFYVLHCVFLPAVLFLLFSYHMWRIRKDGGLAAVDRAAAVVPAPPAKTKTYSLMGIARGLSVHVEAARATGLGTEGIRSAPHLVRRLLAVLVLTLAAVTALAVAFPAPLEAPANPTVTPNPAKAPWYFLWLQELVADTTFRIGGITVDGALVGGIIVPGLLAALLAAWPWLDRSPKAAIGAWFHPSRRLQNALFAVVVAAIVVLLVVGTFLRGPYWRLYWPGEAWPPLPGRL